VQFYGIATCRRNGFFYWLNFKRQKRYACDADSKIMGKLHFPSKQEREDGTPGDVKRKKLPLKEVAFAVHALVGLIDLIRDLL